jgi:Flp pilus assembly protein protease CpaA
MSEVWPLLFAFVPLFFVGAVQDMKVREIKSYVWIGCWVIGLFEMFYFPVAASERLLLIGLFAGLPFLLWKSGALGGGDAKMLMGLGFGLPWSAAIPFYIAWGLSSLPYGWLFKKLSSRRKAIQSRVPLVPLLLGCLCLAAIVLAAS